MENVRKSPAFLRKRKMMLVLPLLVLPFLTMAFWAMGGGKSGNKKPSQVQTQGLNLQLPNAVIKDDKMADKMSFYDQSDRDSIKMAELIRNDPYFRKEDSLQSAYLNELEYITESSAEKFNQSSITQQTGLKTTPYDRSGNPTEEKVIKKLAELNNIINQSENSALQNNNKEKYEDTENYSLGSDVDRLESMMKVMSEKGNGNDPEIKQLENTLDKILDIQHPERVKDRIKEKSLKTKETVFGITTVPKQENISLLDTGEEKINNGSGFFELDGPSNEIDNNAIQAVINENQVLVTGAVVKLRLVDNVYINGFLIPKGNFVFGIASLSAERLSIEINSIRCNNSIYPVKLEVYDIDGLPGIYIPGAITRDVAKQSMDNSLQLLELSTMDPSLKAQATAAGIDAAKTLITKKVKQVKVLVKAGYRVLLKDKSAH